jgi:hypothetical protein
VSVAGRDRTATGRPARTSAAGSAAVAVLATLALGATAGRPIAPAVGLLAGLALAGAARTADGPRREPLRSGLLAALGGLLGLAGVAAVTLGEVPWPPVPPVPYLPAAPFLLLLAGGTVGFGAAATAWSISPARAGRAGRRAAAVGSLPLSVVVIDAGGAALLVGLAAVGVALWRRFAPDASAVAVGAALVVPLLAAHDRLATVAVDAAATEARRRFLVETLEATGSLGAVAAVMVAALALAALFLLAVWLAGELGLLDGGIGPQMAGLGAFLAAVAAGVAGVHFAVVFSGVAASLLAWDLGEFAATLGAEVGRAGASRRAEFVHAAGGLALAAVAALAATAVGGLIGVLSASSTQAAVVAAAAAAVGCSVLVVALR